MADIPFHQSSNKPVREVDEAGFWILIQIHAAQLAQTVELLGGADTLVEQVLVLRNILMSLYLA